MSSISYRLSLCDTSEYQKVLYTPDQLKYNEYTLREGSPASEFYSNSLSRHNSGQPEGLKMEHVSHVSGSQQDIQRNTSRLGVCSGPDTRRQADARYQRQLQSDKQDVEQE